GIVELSACYLNDRLYLRCDSKPSLGVNVCATNWFSNDDGRTGSSLARRLRQVRHRIGKVVGEYQNLVQIHGLEDVKEIWPDAEENRSPLPAVNSPLERHQEADFRARQIVDLAQVDGKARVRVRLDQLVEPVALGGLPVRRPVVTGLERKHEDAIHFPG